MKILDFRKRWLLQTMRFERMTWMRFSSRATRQATLHTMQSNDVWRHSRVTYRD